MREIFFIEAAAVNFCNHYSIRIEFKNGKVTLIVGPNGSGKTTIFDIIPWVLYGITSKGLRGDSVVNKTIGKDCSGFVTFKINQDIYKVERYVKHTKHGDTVLISKNDGKPYKKGQKEILPEIERLFVPTSLFFNTLFFSQKVKDFFTDLTDSDKKTIFRKVLQTDEYEMYYKETTERIKTWEVKLTKVDNDIEITKGLLKAVEESMIKFSEDLKKFEETKESDIREVKLLIHKESSSLDALKMKFSDFIKKDLDSDLVNVNKDIVQLQNDIKTERSNLQTTISEINTKRTAKETELRNAATIMIKNETAGKNQEITTLLVEKEKVTNELTTVILNLNSDLKSYMTEFDNLNSSIKTETEKRNQFETSLKAEKVYCPTCKQEVAGDARKHVEEELESVLEKILDLQNKLKICVSKGKEIQSERDFHFIKLEESKKEFDDKVKVIRESIKKIEEDVEDKLDDKLETLEKLSKSKIDEIKNNSSKLIIDLEKKLENKNTESEKLADQILEKKLKEKEIQLCESEIKRLNSVLEEKESQTFDKSNIEDFSTKIKSYSHKIFELEKTKKNILENVECLEFWKKGFSPTGIPAMLIDEAIPFMNKQIRTYLDKMGGRYLVSFDTMAETKGGEFRDKISVKVLDTLTKADDRKALSGGQTRLVDVACILTLADLQSLIQDMKINILLLDEIFDSLDEENIKYVSGVLKTLVGTDKSINIISHRHIDQIEYDDILRLY